MLLVDQRIVCIGVDGMITTDIFRVNILCFYSIEVALMKSDVRKHESFVFDDLAYIHTIRDFREICVHIQNPVILLRPTTVTDGIATTFRDCGYLSCVIVMDGNYFTDLMVIRRLTLGLVPFQGYNLWNDFYIVLSAYEIEIKRKRNADNIFLKIWFARLLTK